MDGRDRLVGWLRQAEAADLPPLELPGEVEAGVDEDVDPPDPLDESDEDDEDDES
ncbi:MAG: hypothetical protein QOE05_3319, partial [Actinomycetota bacterium]|nr:hypothetical protein [Actinomycetota bacterium]